MSFPVHRHRAALLVAGTALAVTGVAAGTAAASSLSGSAQDAASNSATSRVTAPPSAALVLPHAEARFAVINADGTRSRSSAGVTSGPTGLTGNYEVLFDRDVRACAYTATIGSTAAGAASPGFITAQQRSGKVNGVFLTVKDTLGNRIAQPFHLVVTC